MSLSVTRYRQKPVTFKNTPKIDNSIDIQGPEFRRFCIELTFKMPVVELNLAKVVVEIQLFVNGHFAKIAFFLHFQPHEAFS